MIGDFEESPPPPERPVQGMFADDGLRPGEKLNSAWFKVIDGRIAFYPWSMLSHGYFVSAETRRTVQAQVESMLPFTLLAMWPVSLLAFWLLDWNFWAGLLFACLSFILFACWSALGSAVRGVEKTEEQLTWTEMTRDYIHDVRRRELAVLTLLGLGCLFFGTMLVVDRHPQRIQDIGGGILLLLLGMTALGWIIQVVHAKGDHAQAVIEQNRAGQSEAETDL